MRSRRRSGWGRVADDALPSPRVAAGWRGRWWRNLSTDRFLGLTDRFLGPTGVWALGGSVFAELDGRGLWRHGAIAGAV